MNYVQILTQNHVHRDIYEYNLVPVLVVIDLNAIYCNDCHHELLVVAIYYKAVGPGICMIWMCRQAT
jgi:hypothetical protein